ncbi:MAG: amino acid permease [Methanothrix sp.]|jgi:APA family basic amino acid/polyamine antiporter|nr:amino acid permease [Methanothrix harundinacea]MDD3709168.1 amino acid permease [Methanothrix sp.]MDD5767876.1 amino acid permease [Methanothrix sp.]MDI9400020.1 amino acid permease [Euryarchaeota archaeon]
MKEPEKMELKRELGLFEVTLSGVGIILGAGIYALIGKAAAQAGNSVWLSFAIAALIAVFTGLSYAELSSIFPRASAEYEYTNRAFGRKLAFVVGWLIIFSGVIGASTVALGFGGYFLALTGLPVLPSAVVLILLLSLVLLWGIKISAWFAIVFTLIETAGLLIVIYIGLPHFGSVDYFEMPHGFNGVFEAAALIFFAYMGFEEMVKLSEETREPERNIPLALILALAITIVLYMLVAVSVVSVVSWETLAASDAPFSEVAAEALGADAFVVISAIALFATANTVLLMLLAGSRIAYGMAESSSLPDFLAKVHPKRRTPWAAILVVMLLSMGFVFSGDIAFVASANDFILFATFVVINASLIYLRRIDPTRPRPFRVPMSLGWVPVPPVFGILTCIFLIFHLEPAAVLLGAALAVVGVLLAFVCCRKSA